MQARLFYQEDLKKLDAEITQFQITTDGLAKEVKTAYAALCAAHAARLSKLKENLHDPSGEENFRQFQESPLYALVYLQENALDGCNGFTLMKSAKYQTLKGYVDNPELQKRETEAVQLAVNGLRNAMSTLEKARENKLYFYAYQYTIRETMPYEPPATFRLR